MDLGQLIPDLSQPAAAPVCCGAATRRRRAGTRAGTWFHILQQCKFEIDLDSEPEASAP